jgi:hypothetical protein
MIELPWPPSTLSGHAKGHWYTTSPIVAKHRAWAKNATVAANIGPVPVEGDIHIGFTFYPPDRRSDRCNFANRLKAYIDGIADALKVNDRRFLPAYHFAEPVRGDGKIVVTIGSQT